MMLMIIVNKRELVLALRLRVFANCRYRCDILAQEFLWISIPHIRQLISSKKGLYSAYITLHHEYIYPGTQSPHLRLKRPRPSLKSSMTWDHDLISELNAAKRRAAKDAGKRYFRHITT